MSDEEIQAKPGLSDIDFIDTDGKCMISFAYQDEGWIVKNIGVQVRKRTLRESHRRQTMTQNWSKNGTSDLDLARLKLQYEGVEAVWGALIEASVSEFLAEKESGQWEAGTHLVLEIGKGRILEIFQALD